MYSIHTVIGRLSFSVHHVSIVHVGISKRGKLARVLYRYRKACIYSTSDAGGGIRVAENKTNTLREKRSTEERTY